MVLELPTVNWEVGLRWCHVYVEGSSESGGKWLQVITFTCGQCSSNRDEAAQRSENLHENPSGNAVFGVDWDCTEQERATGNLPEDSCLGQQHRALLPATAQCLLCSCWDCALRTPRDASWNTLQINHKLLWHLCLPFLFTLQMKRQKAFLCTEWDCALICFRTGIFWCFSLWYFCFLQSGLVFLIQACYLILRERCTSTVVLMRRQSLFLLLSWPLLINPSNLWFKKFRTV